MVKLHNSEIGADPVKIMEGGLQVRFSLQNTSKDKLDIVIAWWQPEYYQ